MSTTDDYEIRVVTGLKRITGFRLEALTDPSLGFRGPGRKANFVLTEFAVSLQQARPTPGNWTSPRGGRPQRRVVESRRGDRSIPDKGWGVWDGVNKPHRIARRSSG
ncbi:MAG: hypothetical protein CM1200mP2_01870 [Planctomycetaceae bacterium]|nr:MAG: hypothetical protein CM1200mP2_01870 [Planctomycetaceae bacterium]